MPIHLQDDDPQLTEEFYRPASGAGGQHLNKTSNGVRLSYDYLASPLIPAEVKERISALAGNLLSGGKLVILEKDSRSLQQNRDQAKIRLEEFLETAFRIPKKRKKTKVSRAAKERRLSSKAKHSAIKAARKRPGIGD